MSDSDSLAYLVAFRALANATERCEQLAVSLEQACSEFKNWRRLAQGRPPGIQGWEPEYLPSSVEITTALGDWKEAKDRLDFAWKKLTPNERIGLAVPPTA